MKITVTLDEGDRKTTVTQEFAVEFVEDRSLTGPTRRETTTDVRGIGARALEGALVAGGHA